MTYRPWDPSVWGPFALALVLLGSGGPTCVVAQNSTVFTVPTPGGGRLVNARVAAVVNGTTTVASSNSPQGYKDLDVQINITAGGTDAGTLQLFVEDSIDGGVTWDDMVASKLFTFGSAPRIEIYQLSSAFVAGTNRTIRVPGATPAAESMAPGTSRSGPMGTILRIREVVTNVAGTPTGATYTVDTLWK